MGIRLQRVNKGNLVTYNVTNMFKGYCYDTNVCDLLV